MKSETAEILIPALTEQVDRRKSLLQAAFDVIASSGFEGLRTRAVAKGRASTLPRCIITSRPSRRWSRGWRSFSRESSPAFMRRGHRARGGRRSTIFVRNSSTPGSTTNVIPSWDVVLQELTLRANRDPAVESALSSLMSSWRSWIESIVRQGDRGSDLPPEPRSSNDYPDADGGLRGGQLGGIEELRNIQRGVEEWLLAPEVKEEIQGVKCMTSNDLHVARDRRRHWRPVPRSGAEEGRNQGRCL